MNDLPGHFSPTYSEDAAEDALFHYTTANGIIGIVSEGQIRSTAYYCANDESELSSGKWVLSPVFSSKTRELIEEGNSLVETFNRRGVDIRSHAERFEQTIIARALSLLCVYITCFCKPADKEDFQHGLLSQWRAYGIDGGYALQFSRKKLLKAIESPNSEHRLSYALQDVYYTPDNPLKEKVYSHNAAFLHAYMDFLGELETFDFSKKTINNPIAELLGGPLESLLDYLIHTKNPHFSEERECRLSCLEPVSSVKGDMPVQYHNRGGMIVPYTVTPVHSFDILSCVDWIIIGPGPRMKARFNSVVQMVKKSGRDIKVRPSHIPFTRI